jgi:hypothetical protein
MILSNMANVLRAAGLTVVEVAGWQNRGFNGKDILGVRGILWHHTVGPRSRFPFDNMPSLNVLINGRPGVGGPLSQLGLGRDGTVYVVAAGLCNHAGAGALPGIPRDQGNYYMIGVEMESSGVAPWDWTPDQIRVVPYLGAALERAYLLHLPEPQRIQAAHKEYSSEGKIDPAGWPGDMNGLRDSINAVLSGVNPQGSTKEEVMAAPTANEIAQAVLHTQIDWMGFGGVQPKEGRTKTSLAMQTGWLDTQFQAVYSQLAASQAQIANLVGAVAALAKGEEFDEAKLLAGVRAAAEAGVKTAIASIETTVTIAKEV